MSNNEIREKRKKVICDLVKDDFYVPMKEKELAMFLQVAKEDREEFREILRELLAEGKLTLTVKGKYMKSNGKVLTGTFISNAKGFGFVEVEGRDEDLFIPEDKQGGAFHKDTVEVALLPAKTGKRQEAQVIRIIARGMTQVVGTYEQSKSNFGFVIPDNTKIAQDIFVPKEWSKGAMTGHKVVVEITGYGTNTKSPEGKVVEILGHINDPGVDIMSIVRGFDLPVEFGEKIMSQVERVSQEVSEADCAGRRDLRDVTMVTIDGEDAKDLDDAVSVSFDGTYYHLGVHIADVTNYVQENSELDREALKRGTSVYLVDRVIPMLPEALSNGVCSLNAGEDKLTFSAIIELDRQGTILSFRFRKSIINSKVRGVYGEVNQLFNGTADKALRKKYSPVIRSLHAARELAEILKARAKRSGTVELDSTESRFVLDGQGVCVDVQPRESGEAEQMIEQLMITANQAAAQLAKRANLPFVYRIHEQPAPDRVESLADLVGALGLNPVSLRHSASVKTADFAAIMEQAEGTPAQRVISHQLLRTMAKARYDTQPVGHFGLALEDYCHFTSPIRRYPDTAIHRILSAYLAKDKQIAAHYTEFAREAASNSSKCEVRAMAAERSAEDCYMAEYMRQHIGEEATGVISGVTMRGVFVELPNTVEGFVPITSFEGAHFEFDGMITQYDATTGRKLTIGQPLRVKAVAADVASGRIDFLPVEPTPENA